jgi:hypothetical protein
MKKLILLLLFSNLIVGQQSVELRLVSSTVGAPDFSFTNSSTQSNDAGLNAILLANNVTSYIGKYGHPYPPVSDKIVQVDCNCNTDQLISELTSYAAVVQAAQSVPQFEFPDALVARLQSINSGIPTGVVNNIVVTNDTYLNQIFQDFNVYYYSLYAPSSTNESLLRTYNLVCDCNKNLLKAALDNYPSVIELTEFATAGYLLGTPAFPTPDFVIYPNPFETAFHIRSNETFKSYRLFDAGGKLIVSTSSENELTNTGMLLSPGLYFLTLESGNGSTFSAKVIKQ